MAACETGCCGTKVEDNSPPAVETGGFSTGCCDSKESHDHVHDHNHDHKEEHHSHDHHHHNGHSHDHSHEEQSEESKQMARSHDGSHEKDEEEDGGVLCLAVVRESGADISLFDASGDVRSFSYKGDIRKLCFSSHGQQADDLLTPCFDDAGNHGAPEEGCFCGVETPHLHAHVHDPNTCNDDIPDTTEANLMTLAQLTLHPTEESKNSSLFQIPVSERMPKECNSKDFGQHLSTGGDSLHAPLEKRRMHKVKHDDHEDYLVHNKTTGELHLEHPCTDCGDSDYHGKFRLVGKRKLKRSSDVQLHFFEVTERKFSFMHLFEPESSRVETFRQEGLKIPARKTVVKEKPLCCSSGTCTAKMIEPIKVEAEKPSCCSSGTCSKSAPVEKPSCCSNGTCSKSTMDTSSVSDTTIAMESDAGKRKIVRSTMYCSGICCSSEVPLVNSALEPLDGVEKIMINVPLRNVIIDHDPSVVTAKILKDILNQNDFGASIRRDGGAKQKQTGQGKSKFYVDKICCASEIPMINSVINPIEGTSAVSINVTTKMVYVEHDTSIVSAQTICDALNADRFGARIEHDAGTETVSVSAFVTSVLSYDTPDSEAPTTEALTDFLKTLDPSQIETFLVDVPSQKITVVHNPLLLSASDIVSTLGEKTGLEAKISRNGAEHQIWDFPDNVEEEVVEEQTSHVRPTVVLSGVFWIISMLSFIGGDWEYLKYVALLSVAFGLPPIAIKAIRTLRRLQFDANCLMFFAACGAVALQDFTEAAAVTFLFSFSEWLEVRATTRARDALSAIVKLRPESANLVHPKTGEIVVIPASAVPIGALVSVRTGDKIPCDGVVVEGRSTVDESSLTGESRPVRKGPKDMVSGGTINSGSTQLMIRTTCTADDSAVARLIRLVEEAQANRSETEKLVDEFARIYTPLVVLSALLMCTIPWVWGRDIGAEWTHNGLVLIVIACPCALIISTPVAYVAGLAATAQRGVLIKGGAHLEALGLVKKICFDKTGTLTEGKFRLLNLNVIGQKRERKEVLEYLSLMEERASHPLGQAIVEAARNEGVSIPKSLFVKDHTFLAGEGVSGVINGVPVYVGNMRLFKRLGILDKLEKSERKSAEQWESTGGTVGFMSIGEDGIVCSYCVADKVRSEARDVVSRFKDMGIDITMLTGDNNDAALVIGKQVGLSGEEIKSQLLPEEKLSLVSVMKDDDSIGGKSVLANFFSTRRLVLMCGDGVNDAPALAMADVGVAMGAGAALAMESADVTLLDSHLSKLIYSVEMGRRVIRKIKENVIFSLAVKFVVLGFALAGKAQLWAAIASDVGAMIIVTLNGMLLLPSKKSVKNMHSDEKAKGDLEEDAEMHDSHDHLEEDLVNSLQTSTSSERKGACSGHSLAHGHAHEISESKHVEHSSQHNHAHGRAKEDQDIATEDVSSCSGHNDAHGHAKEDQDIATEDVPSCSGHNHAHGHVKEDEDIATEDVSSCSGHNHAHGHVKEDIAHNHAHDHAKVDEYIATKDAPMPSGHAHGHDQVHADSSSKEKHSSSGHSHAHEHHPVDDDTIIDC